MKDMTILRKVILALSFCIYSSFSLMAQETRLFEIVRKGDSESLKTYLDTSKTSINITNAKGYSPLHVLIENFVEERPEWQEKDAYKYQQTVNQSGQYQSCLQLLLNKGASASQLTPEGWTALQYAVMKGKWQPIQILLEKTKGGDVKDKEGNTLLHLSLLINPDEPIESFWKNLIVQLSPLNITPATVNYQRQTPINFYLSQPRCNPPASKAAPAGKLLGASAPATTTQCRTNRTSQMLNYFLCQPCIMTPDQAGKTAKAHAEQHHPWYLSTLSMQEQQYAVGAAIDKEYEDVSERNNRATDEFLIKLAEWEAQGAMLDLSFTKTYYSECNSYQKNRIRLDEPVVISVTPDEISISSLSPYYGSFKIASSGYEVINGNQWAVYHLEQSSTNSTYKAIGFYENGCIIKSSYGEELICY